ncbi:DUF7507 domain-containing protein [Catenulispora yoronensis]|uniref:DUF7507 domain-containing protein n=1 Tax=Catenulispora yoronensis TaxID=450799 RepID=UPI0031DBF9C5
MTVQPTGQLTVTKSANPTTVTAAGQHVVYSFEVSNPGHVTITDLGVTDTAFSGTGSTPVITCPVTTLAPGGSTTCTASYIVTQADVDAGQIANTAVAHGSSPTGDAVDSPPSSATVTAKHTPSLTVSKSATPATVNDAGDVIS